MNPNPSFPGPQPAATRWQRFSAASVRAFHVYAGWLVSISWWRFWALSILLMILASVLSTLPPFRWTISETILGDPDHPLPEPPDAPKAPKASGRADEPPAPPAPPGKRASGSGTQVIRIEKDGSDKGMEISIDEKGIRIVRGKSRDAAASAPPAAASGASGASGSLAPASAAASEGEPVVDIKLPPGATSESVRQAVEEAKQAIKEAVADAKEEARQAEQEAKDAQVAKDAKDAGEDSVVTIRPGGGKRKRLTQVSWGDFLPDLAFFWIVASIIIKATYKGRMQAEVKAAQAVETAEAESLRRQVVEARMAAMQAQVEPHFLFNTLASIDHLIETDPKRASQMQKNLIALLRASMPTMREASGNGGTTGVRDLGRELAVISPYLEILKVRMEERLATDIQVPDGLLSAEFPPMMMQTLVENAVKHGLEPKPEGGSLTIKAEIVHGKLAVTVADTGLGFGKAATAGTGVGLANIRERLQMLYGTRATLAIGETPGGGTTVTVTVPYKPVEGADA
jgi:hypothetical protein